MDLNSCRHIRQVNLGGIALPDFWFELRGTPCARMMELFEGAQQCAACNAARSKAG